MYVCEPLFFKPRHLFWGGALNAQEPPSKENTFLHVCGPRVLYKWDFLLEKKKKQLHSTMVEEWTRWSGHSSS
jgi:hypothetical protein